MAKPERHGEIVRQWRILLALETRSRGLTLAEIREAAGDDVTERTIRRDLDALAQAGFPIDTDKDAGKTRYSLNREVFRGVAAAGFTLPELCALYLSRTLVGALAGAPFHDALESAFEKLTDALPPALWAFVDRLPQALAAKEAGGPALVETPAQAAALDVLMPAILGRRRVRMRYHSFSSRREKDYLVEPYRLTYAQGALYLLAFVPEYGQMRTFATQRIADAASLEETFSPLETVPQETFADALGAFSGEPEEVRLVFSAAAAPYVRERRWHGSQQLEDLPEGALGVRLRVALDWSLLAWIRGFGADVRVDSPDHLAEAIRDAAARTQALYAAEPATAKSE